MTVERVLDAILPQFAEFGMLETAVRTKLRKSAKEFQRRIHCIRLIAHYLRIGVAQIPLDLPRHVLMEFERDPHRQAHWPA